MSKSRVAPVPGVGYGDGLKPGRISMLSMFPLLAISLVLFTIGTFAITGEVPADCAAAAGQLAESAKECVKVSWTDGTLVSPKMVSGDIWKITYGDAFIIFSMGLLFIELLRATKTGTDSLVNHALSALLFIAALLLFMIVPGFGNSVFFIFMSMTFLDFMAGFIVTTVTARRDFGVAA